MSFSIKSLIYPSAVGLISYVGFFDNSIISSSTAVLVSAIALYRFFGSSEKEEKTEKVEEIEKVEEVEKEEIKMPSDFDEKTERMWAIALPRFFGSSEKVEQVEEVEKEVKPRNRRARRRERKNLEENNRVQGANNRDITSDFSAKTNLGVNIWDLMSRRAEKVELVETKEIKSQSFFDKKKNIDENNWAITLITASRSSALCRCGHAQIVIEKVKNGEKTISIAHFRRGKRELFGETPGKVILKNISDVKLKYKLKTETWLRTKESVKKMLKEIKADMYWQKHNNPITFSLLGYYSKWVIQTVRRMAGGEIITGPHNCITWAVGKIAFAGIQYEVKPFVKPKQYIKQIRALRDR